ncbi:hypothetical protein RUND412_004165 [Rhizina undulata]
MNRSLISRDVTSGQNPAGSSNPNSYLHPHPHPRRDFTRNIPSTSTMPVTLHGSCHCGAVRFSVGSSTPVAFMLCACSICRKVAGYNGSVNLGAHYDTLKIHKGKELISPELCHPFAPAIDSPELKDPDTMVCIMKNSKPSYVRWPEGNKQIFNEYPELSIEDWHKKNGEYIP